MKKEKPIFLTIAQYANHRGKDQGSVRYAIRNKKIKSFSKDETGAVLIDRDRADEEWVPRQNPREQVEKPSARIKVPPSFEEPQDDQDADLDDDGTMLPSVQRSRQKREKYEAELARIKVDKEKGKLIDAKETEAAWIKIASITRTKVLGLPSKIRQRIPEITDIQYGIIEMVVRESLEEIASENVTSDDNE